MPDETRKPRTIGSKTGKRIFRGSRYKQRKERLKTDSGNNRPSGFRRVLEHGLTQLLKSADLDLAYPFAADAIDLGKVLQSGRLLFQPAFGNDVALTVFQGGQRGGQHMAAHLPFFAFQKKGFLIRPVIHQKVQMFGRVFSGQWRVQRRITSRKTPVHDGHIPFGHIHSLGDLRRLLRGQFSGIDDLELVLDLAQAEEQLLLRRYRADLHHGPRTQDVFRNRRPDPPHGIGRKPETAIGVEPLNRPHKPHIAFRDQVGQRQAIAPIPPGDFSHKAKMAGNEPVGGLGIVMLTPTLGEHKLLLPFQNRKGLGFPKIVVQPAVLGNNG
uniref:Uncharacterized protein n=1 Tax=uncultured marine microorganism HF4000_APKG8K5 TaxID=455555 RepID=B3TB38_9ZZZZ|nr:hypothetical protein ALOHA_HF4000APKG8K5ctg1g16 [uncultured marine microorganism HF4000_APKG8K5]